MRNLIVGTLLIFLVIGIAIGKGAFYTSVPQFCAPFLLDEIREKIYSF